jgi:hypothetical protein
VKTKGWRIVKATVGFALGLLLCASGSVARATPEKDVVRLFELAGFGEQEAARLEAGKIVIPETGALELKDSNILAVLFTWVEAPLDVTARALEQTLDAASGEQARLAAELDEVGPFPAVAFEADEEGEAERLLRFTGGGQFNLGVDEIERLRSVSDAEGSELARASAVLTEVLERRYTQFLDRGLAGVEDYARKGDESASPAMELRLTNDGVKDKLGSVVPKLAQAVAAFPRRMKGMEYRFRVVKKIVNKRPAFLLMSRISESRPDEINVVQTEYYVSHTYNSLYALAILRPYEGGTLVVLATDNFTDKVAGAMSGIAKPIGRKRLRAAVLPLMEDLRTTIESGAR